MTKDPRRFLCISDPHIEIEKDYLVFKDLFDLCEQKNAILTILGDLFNKSYMAPSLIRNFSFMLADSKIPTIILLGNHDMSVDSSYLELLNEYENVVVYGKPALLEDEKTDYVFLPYLSPFSVDIGNFKPKKPYFIFGHYHAKGAVFPSGNKEMKRGGVTFDGYDAKVHCKGGLLGHIHLPQDFRCMNSTFSYIGPTRATASDEAHRPRAILVEDGCVIEKIELKTASWNIYYTIQTKEDLKALMKKKYKERHCLHVVSQLEDTPKKEIEDRFSYMRTVTVKKPKVNVQIQRNLIVSTQLSPSQFVKADESISVERRLLISKVGNFLFKKGKKTSKTIQS